MGLLSEREGTGGSWEAPSNDLYGLWGEDTSSMFKVERKQVILPRVTRKEETMLESVAHYVTDKNKGERKRT